MSDRDMAANLIHSPLREPEVEPNRKRKSVSGFSSRLWNGWAAVRAWVGRASGESNGQKRGLQVLALGLLSLYRFALSPLLHALLGPACRFEPSCSRFAAQAIRDHGLGRGAVLTMKRLARCHPLGGHGYDPVPAAAHCRKK